MELIELALSAAMMKRIRRVAMESGESLETVIRVALAGTLFNDLDYAATAALGGLEQPTEPAAQRRAEG